MAEDDQALLLRLFTSNYTTLKGRLARRLGSVEAAEEALQETYMRVERIERVGAIVRPLPYLFRIAVNTASDLRRSEKRRLQRSEIELLLQLEKDEIDPERVAAARSSLRKLARVLRDLPSRQRTILVATRLEGLTHAAIAARLGISTRLVERELKRALDHCRHYFELNDPKPFGSTGSAASKE
ncbi:MAG TPA: RNA polymerase sigma factor [Methylovirgula sp.]|nr:RNA polymerase sigma factor [Methylovirgula sp.]